LLSQEKLTISPWSGSHLLNTSVHKTSLVHCRRVKVNVQLEWLETNDAQLYLLAALKCWNPPEATTSLNVTRVLIAHQHDVTHTELKSTGSC